MLFSDPVLQRDHSLTGTHEFASFAMMEINLILAKMLWRYDMELVDKDLDWEGRSHMHVMWWKPDLKVRFRERKGA